RYQDAATLKRDVVAALEAAGAPARANARNKIGETAPQAKRARPSVRFHIPTPHGDQVAVRGLLHRAEDSLLVEFEFVKPNMWKKFKDFFQDPDPGRPKEVRIPLEQIASLTYGWGWGRPPRSLILKTRRLSALAGIPGSKLGELPLYVERE